MEKAPPPPPRREYTPTAKTGDPEPSTWSSKMKAKGGVWGKIAVDKGTIWSDKIGARVNDVAEKKFGVEHFYPVTGDMPKEIEKCARILRLFTVEGIVKEETAADADETDAKGKKKKKTVKVLRKIPPKVIQEAQGIVIFTAMRSGFAPFGGAGGSGVVVARLPDGSWSAPASISPNNFSTGLLAGIDVYDCILVLRDPRAVQGFFGHKFTLGAEIGVAAGPYGSGASIESGKEKAAVFSYIRSKGLYAGIEITGTIFVERFDENGQMYHWNGVKAGDILSGKVKVPPQCMSLHEALRDAETGKAQHLQGNSLDTVLDEHNRPLTSMEASKLDLDEGEILKLPPTPEMTDGTEYQSDPETNKVHYPSRPGSGASTPNSTMRRVPPMLPPRSSTGASAGAGAAAGAGLVAGSTSLRPPLDRNDSSTSHYSDAVDNDKANGAGGLGSAGIPTDGPPGYSDHDGAPTTYPAEKTDSAIPAYDHSSAPSTYPTEKGTSEIAAPAGTAVPGYDYDHATSPPAAAAAAAQSSIPGSYAYADQPPVGAPPPHDEMDEGERREWEQFHADQELAQRAGGIDLNANQVAKDESLR